MWGAMLRPLKPSRVLAAEQAEAGFSKNPDHSELLPHNIAPKFRTPKFRRRFGNKREGSALICSNPKLGV
jgi:hypothetical protein